MSTGDTVKIRTYEKIIDRIVTIAINTFWLGCLYVPSFIIFAIVAALSGEMTWGTIWVYFAALIPAGIVFFYAVFYQKAAERYGKIRLRDFWMYNATDLSYMVTEEEERECMIWIDENINGFHQLKGNSHFDSLNPTRKRRFIFKKKTDAMAFKLAWEGQLTAELN